MNLHILAKRFTHLFDAEFFNPAFKRFLAETINAINHVLEDPSKYPETVLRQFEAKLWRVRQFLLGSKSTDAPHETQYVLTKALKSWITDDALISSASLDQFGFFLDPEDMWSFIGNYITGFDAGGYAPLLVRIGSPEPYKHRPVFCTPLFHELGHFVDVHFKITELSLLTSPIGAPQGGLSIAQWEGVNRSHRMEYFADLFSASYVGNAGSQTLATIAPNAKDNFTHPATSKRLAIINDFIAGNSNDIVDLFQGVLKNMKQPALECHFDIPKINDQFDDALTYKIENIGELYGIYDASMTYLHDQLNNRTANWIDDTATDYTIEKTINDLTEKSIRNFEIRERWQGVIAD